MNTGELHRRTIDLAATFSERGPDKQWAWVREYADAGEWGEAVDLMVAALVVKRIPVTPAERDQVAALVEATKLEPTEPLDKLTVRP